MSNHKQDKSHVELDLSVTNLNFSNVVHEKGYMSAHWKNILHGIPPWDVPSTIFHKQATIWGKVLSLYGAVSPWRNPMDSESSNAMVGDNWDLASMVKRREGEVEPVKKCMNYFSSEEGGTPTPAQYLPMANEQVGLHVPRA